MNEMNADQKRAKKFQERLERISRRRFLQVAALGGATTVGLLGKSESIVNAEISDQQRCKNTRDLLGGRNTLEEVFKDRRVKELLAENKGKLSDAQQVLVDDIINAIKDDDRLRDFYMEDKEVDLNEYPNLARALNAAEDEFVFPFRRNCKDTAMLLLAGDDSPFLQAFGWDTVTHFFTKKRRVIRGDDLVILERAVKGRFFTAKKGHEVCAENRTLASNKCADWRSGKWDCDTPYQDGKCDLDIDNEPTPSSDMCP